MAELRSYFFFVGISRDIPTGVDVVTDPLEFNFTYSWVLFPYFSGVGNPTYTLEMSSTGGTDPSEWATYDVFAENIAINQIALARVTYNNTNNPNKCFVMSLPNGTTLPSSIVSGRVQTGNAFYTSFYSL